MFRRDSPAVEDLADDPAVKFRGGNTCARTSFPEPEKFPGKAAEKGGETFQKTGALIAAQKGLPAERDERRLRAALPGRTDTDAPQQFCADPLCSVYHEPAHGFFIFPRCRKVTQEPGPLFGTPLRGICLGQIKAQVILFSAAVRQTHQQEPGPGFSRQKAAVQKTSDSFCKLFRDRIVLSGFDPEAHIRAASESDPLRKSIGILRGMVFLLRRLFIQGIGEAFRVAVSLLILQENRIGVTVDRQKSDSAADREDLLSAETVIDHHRADCTGSGRAKDGISPRRNAVLRILCRHAVTPVFLEIGQRNMCFHSAGVPPVGLQRQILSAH